MAVMLKGNRMSADQDRAELLKLLEQLGAEEDPLVLEAAREVHRRVVVEGEGWDSLLAPADSNAYDTTARDSELPTPEDESDSFTDSDPVAAPFTASEADLEILERLMRRTDISVETQEELKGLRADIEEGSFSGMDAAYLRALDERLRPS